MKPKVGIPFLVIGISGQKSFIAIGVVFMALGAALMARQRGTP